MIIKINSCDNFLFHANGFYAIPHGFKLLVAYKMYKILLRVSEKGGHNAVGKIEC